MGQLPDIDFFISRKGHERDIEIAKHVNAILTKAGYSTLLQDEHFGHNSFMAMMEEGFDNVEKNACVISIVSKDYLSTDHCVVECQYPLISDPLNRRKRLILLCVDDIAPTGLFQSIPFFDLNLLLDKPDLFEQGILFATGHIKKDVTPDWFETLIKKEQICHPAIKYTPNFTGREAELSKLKHVLSTDKRAATTQSVAIYGLGGVGKSALAREYAWSNRALYAGLWWINADQETSIQEGLVALGSQFIPGLSETKDLAAAANATLDYLAQYYADAEEPWLIVYDNVESEELFRKYGPKGGVHALLTSRIANFSAELSSIEVGSWPELEAIEYLKRESGRGFADEEAKELSHALNCLPLTLSHAAAFLKQERYTQISHYIREINEWLNEAPAHASFPKAVFATFAQAITKCEEKAPGVSAILALSVFFAPNRIYLEFFEQDRKLYPELFQKLAVNQKNLRSAFSALNHYSLIDLNMDERCFSIHRLIQAIAKEGLGEEGNLWGAAAVRVLNRMYPNPEDINSWALCEVLNPHTLHINEHVSDDINEEFAILLNDTGFYLNEHGQYEKAEWLFRRALTIDKTSLGPDHPDVAIDLNNLARLLRTTNRFEEAVPLYKQALKIFEANLPKGHPHILTVQKNLQACLNNTS